MGEEPRLEYKCLRLWLAPDSTRGSVAATEGRWSRQVQGWLDGFLLHFRTLGDIPEDMDFGWEDAVCDEVPYPFKEGNVGDPLWKKALDIYLEQVSAGLDQDTHVNRHANDEEEETIGGDNH